MSAQKSTSLVAKEHWWCRTFPLNYNPALKKILFRISGNNTLQNGTLSVWTIENHENHEHSSRGYFMFRVRDRNYRLQFCDILFRPRRKMRRNNDSNVPGYRLQHDQNAQFAQSRNPRRGWFGSTPILAACWNQMFKRSEIFPLLNVCTNLSTRLSKSSTTLPGSLQKSPWRMRANYESIRV